MKILVATDGSPSSGAAVASVAARIRRPGLAVTTQILEGAPKHLIVEEAERVGADLIVLGTHGHGPAGRFLLGSVAHSVVLHAPCSVEVIRTRQATT